MKKTVLLLVTLYSAISAETKVYIETERLLLRSWQESDIEIIYNLMQDPEVNKYLAVHGAHKRENIEKMIAKASLSLAENGYGYLVCQEKQSGDLMGFVGLNYIALEKEPFPCFTVSWILAKKYWHNGYATEAGKALINFAFEKHTIKEVFACTVVDNSASINVMKRLNMQYVKTFDFPGVAIEHPHCKHVLYKIIQ